MTSRTAPSRDITGVITEIVSDSRWSPSLLCGRRLQGTRCSRDGSNAPIDIAQLVGRASQRSDAPTDYLEFESLLARHFHQDNQIESNPRCVPMFFVSDLWATRNRLAFTRRTVSPFSALWKSPARRCRQGPRSPASAPNRSVAAGRRPQPGTVNAAPGGRRNHRQSSPIRLSCDATRRLARRVCDRLPRGPQRNQFKAQRALQ